MNRQSKLVSVIIPSYNHGRFLMEAISSVLNQTYKKLELIIIDDGSTDGSTTVLQSLTDSRVHVTCRENKGAHITINEGLSRARGEFVSILNSDDVFAQNRLEVCVKYLDDHPDVALVSTWIELIDQSSTVRGIKKGWNNMLPWSIDTSEHTFLELKSFAHNLLATNFVATTSNIFLRRSILKKVGLMQNLRFAHDWDFLLRVAADHTCHLLPKPLLQYRTHGANTISQDRRHMLFEVLWVLAANLPRFESSLLFNTESEAHDFRMLYHSINLQHNDKAFWVLRSLMNGLESRGQSVNTILDDPIIKSSVMGLIVE